ncbi:MAG: transporter [Hyphomicrobiaceae bacterium]|nr:transporter [Hyphomicrobiaceae bacterium]
MTKKHPTAALAAKAALAVTACAFVASPAHAHHPGGPGNSSGAGPINTISATSLAAGSGVVGVVLDHTFLDALSDQTLTTAVEAAYNQGEHAHIHSLDSLTALSLNIAYGITDDLTLALRLPHVSRKGIRAGHVHAGPPVEFEVHDEGSTSGVGDLSLLAQWRFLKGPSGFEAALLGGVKAPTGRTEEKNGDGEVLDAEFQPGSGSWDGMFGLALTRRVAAWSFDASFLYTLVTEGSQSTDLGDRVNYGLAVSYRIVGQEAGGHVHEGRAHVHPQGPSLDLVLELNGEWHDRQRSPGEVDENSGGNVLYVSPGVRLSLDRVTGFASIGVPVLTDLNGVQSEPDWRLVTGVSVGF